MTEFAGQFFQIFFLKPKTMSTQKKIYTILTSLLVISTVSKAQVSTLEMVTGTPTDNTYNLPVVGYNFGTTTSDHVVTFLKDVANNSIFTNYSPIPGGPVTATFSFLQQNYTGFNYGQAGNQLNSGLSFGAGPSLSTGGTVQEPGKLNSYDIMNAFYGAGTGPNNSMFTSNLGFPGQGIKGEAGGPLAENDINSGVEVFTAAQRLYDLGAAYGTANRYDYGTLRITFSRYVKDPVLHIAGLGGSYRYLPNGQPDIPANYLSSYFSTELELIGPGSPVKLSGNPFLITSGKNILNNATIPNGGSQTNLGNFNNYGAATGSVQILGTFKTITLKVWLRGCDASNFGWSSPGIGVVTGATRAPLTGDVWMLSTSFEEQQLITLPSTGVTLNAKLTGNDVAISWKTLTELNTDHFDIERSSDGLNFVKISAKAAAGYSTTEINYADIDANMTTDVYYYRLRIVDQDGRSTYSNIAIVKKAGGIKGVRVFPNPANSNVSLEISNLKGDYFVNIFNQAGQIVYTRRINVQQGVQFVPIERGSLSAGSYLVRVKSVDGDEQYIQKVLFQ